MTSNTTYPPSTTLSTSPSTSETISTTYSSSLAATTTTTTSYAKSSGVRTSNSASISPSATVSSFALSSGINPTATGSNSTTSPDSTHSKSSSAQFSSGTLAGAIVGSFAGGLLLAFLAAFLFYRSRKQSGRAEAGQRTWHGENDAMKGPEQSIAGVSGLATSAQPVKPLPTASAWGSRQLDLSSYVPQPADDSAVCMRIQVLFDQASLHIDNYYSRTSSNPHLTQDIVDRLGQYDSSYLPTSLATILSSPRAQRPVLTHTFVRSILQAIQPEAQTLSLLPACYGSPRRETGVADTSMSTNSKLSLKSLTNSIIIDTDQATFVWRMVTSYLYTHNQTTPTTSSGAIAEFAESFTKAFAPYSNPQFSEAERLRHLISVSKAAADLGVWLFSQPCSIEFRWTDAGFSGSQVVTIPAVVKVSDENGERLVVPQTLAEETAVHI